MRDPVDVVRIDDSARPPGEPREVLASEPTHNDAPADQLGARESTGQRGDPEPEVTTDWTSDETTNGRLIRTDEERLDAVVVSVMAGGGPDTAADADWGTTDTAEHLPNEIELTDYAHELASPSPT
ncbi:hypothetical protein PF010_g2164 [Phytophthora fragariae]|uniref:Uncharacterized protein n=1 Tax=Phytophthora fragariae TaxID=53985 RepID=A0A6A4AF73_9STRA|nr:hypothetical protein PF003_g20026 [Phytophthora fragariae]KAE9135160.1 hypothetical protein PF010_g2164 [Phytophthora fragariae]KAE9254951.1 hypothetical protein PF002_g2592 [Phytophthora fragariae]